MLSERLNNALNLQINKEFYSAYLYLSIAHFFNEHGLSGFGHWCKKQANEEIEHGIMIFNFLTALNGKIEFNQINSPTHIFKSPIESIKEILNHEKYITESLKSVTIIANEENAFTTKCFLEKMLEEQIEEEATTYNIYSKLKLFGESKSALYHIDRELHSRQ